MTTTAAPLGATSVGRPSATPACWVSRITIGGRAGPIAMVLTRPSASVLPAPSGPPPPNAVHGPGAILSLAAVPAHDPDAPAIVLSPLLDDAVWACFSLLIGDEPLAVATA